MVLFLDSEKKNVIGPYIKELRLKNNLSQIELCARLEVQGVYISRSSISKIENQKRIVTDIELIALAQALNVNINIPFSMEKTNLIRTTIQY